MRASLLLRQRQQLSPVRHQAGGLSRSLALSCRRWRSGPLSLWYLNYHTQLGQPRVQPPRPPMTTDVCATFPLRDRKLTFTLTASPAPHRSFAAIVWAPIWPRVPRVASYRRALRVAQRFGRPSLAGKGHIPVWWCCRLGGSRNYRSVTHGVGRQRRP